MPRKTQAQQPANSQLEIGAVFEHELQSLHEDLRRQAVMATFAKLQPGNKITVEQFLQGIKQHKEVWNVVANMGIVDFADAINDGKRLRDLVRSRHLELRADGKRTRLSEHQKQALKGLVVRALAEHKEGLSRADIAKRIAPEQVIQLSIDPRELANKLRQPLGELTDEGRIYTVGEKRLLRYFASPTNKGKKEKAEKA
jgi:hypothetical protein